MLPFELTKDTPYLALSGELWSVFYEYFNKNWPCYKGFLLYYEVLSYYTIWSVMNVWSIYTKTTRRSLYLGFTRNKRCNVCNLVSDRHISLFNFAWLVVWKHLLIHLFVKNIPWIFWSIQKQNSEGTDASGWRTLRWIKKATASLKKTLGWNHNGIFHSILIHCKKLQMNELIGGEDIL